MNATPGTTALILIIIPRPNNIILSTTLQLSTHLHHNMFHKHKEVYIVAITKPDLSAVTRLVLHPLGKNSISPLLFMSLVPLFGIVI